MEPTVSEMRDQLEADEYPIDYCRNASDELIIGLWRVVIGQWKD